MKYYIYRISKHTGRKEYKKNKTVDGWVGVAARFYCWRFSESGAKKITKRENANSWHYEYGFEAVEEG